MEEMLSILETYLPLAGAGLPDPTLTLVSLTERTLGLGNRRGTERVAGFAIISLKGGRLDAVARFALWGATPDEVDILTSELQQRLLADRTELWNQGFLMLRQQDTGVAEHISSLGAWRKTTDVKVLYEFHDRDLDGAESLIARIPIHVDPEERNSPVRETTTVRDEIVRWDNHQAETLRVAGSSRAPWALSGLAALAYRPAAFSGAQVTLARLDLDNPAAPTAYPDLPSFLAAVTDPGHPERHGQVVFADLETFLAAFTPAGDPIPLGDWDEDGVEDEYRPGLIRFDHPLRLSGPREQLRITYDDAALGAPAVVYLRAGARRLG
ncbi:hypothetical protein [Geoalkalibacter sp.]|uniref:hypothetical protein n=1 Tax=Geoalkalibacter sp. TaxID=3041440 RepID=UPI00272EA27E|nr:hypothetical protein [Geoalkalibacter sp.]